MNAATPTKAEAETSRRSPARLVAVLTLLVILSAVGVAVFALKRQTHEAQEGARLRALADEGPRVYVVQAAVAPGARDVTLPADARAFNQATLYAKTTGFLKSIKVDKGDHVKRDALLAVIESPETDEQVRSAESDLEIKKRDAERARTLHPSGVISQQDLDHAETALRMSNAQLAQVRALQDYQQVRAPFTGVITQRYLDPGALVQMAVPIVDIADPTQLRVRVDVGQDVAPFVKLGDKVTIWQDERPEVRIDGQVSNMTTALDARTRTMLVEAWVDNTRYNVLPGTFVHATLHVAVPPQPTVPGDALFTRAGKNYVAVISEDRAHFREVSIGLNDGKTAQIQNGLTGTETVALNFPSELDDGARVQPVPMKTEAAPAKK